MKSLLRTEPLLIGRDRELEVLRKYLDSAFSGKGSTVVITGEAGSGKTRLITEFLNVSREREINVLSGWCLHGKAAPYFPFIEAFSGSSIGTARIAETGFSSIISDRNDSGIGQIQRFENPGGSAPQVWKNLTFAAITKELLYLSARKPTVLVLEDIHWADSASLALFHYISRSIGCERILVIATTRNEGLASDSDGNSTLLVKTIRAMNREGLVNEIELSNLALDQVGQMAASMLSGQVNELLVEKLANESHGNPLFIVESLRMLFDEGSLVNDYGGWRLFVNELRIPTKVKDIILQRLGILRPKQRRVLDVASVLGEQFDHRLVGSVLGQEDFLILEKLNAISKATSLVNCNDTSCRFDHAKSREIIYEEIPDLLKAAYHSKIAERLEKIGQLEKKLFAGDIAFHYEKGGNKSKAIAFSLLAGRDALAKFSNLEAKRYFTYVLENINEYDQFNIDQFSAMEGLGDAFFALGEFGEAAKTFEKIFEKSENNLVKLRSLRKALSSARLRGDFARSLDLASRAEELSCVDELEYARVLLYRGAASGSWGKLSDGVNYLETALSLFQKEYSLPDIAQTLNEIASVYQTAGLPEKAISTAKRAVALNVEIADMHGEVDAYFYAGQIFFNCGLPQNALNCFNEAMRISERIGYFTRTAWGALYSGVVLSSIGESSRAISKTLKAVEYAEKLDSHYTLSQCYVNLLELYSKIGDLEKADEYYEKIRKSFPDASKAASKLGYAVLLRSQAVYFAAKDLWLDSNALFVKSLEILKGALFAETFEASTRLEYASALSRQNRLIEAEEQKELATAIFQKSKDLFERVEFDATMMARAQVNVGQRLEIRLDLVNISKLPGSLVKVKNVCPQSFISDPTVQLLQPKNSLELRGRKVEPFDVVTLKLFFTPTLPGTFNLNPELVYLNEKGTLEKFKLKPVKIVVLSETKESSEIKQGFSQADVQESTKLSFEFSVEGADKIFEFLSKSFIDDYMHHRLPLEKSGWRSLMNIAKHGKMSTSTVYGRGGHFGKAIRELEKRGIVEIRYFSGERGRGGNILKLRVSYEKAPVKLIVDRIIMNKYKK